MNVNQVQVEGTAPVGSSTTTSCSYPCPYQKSKAEQGWECPRCGRINAPWKSQCDCSGGYWTTTWTSDKVQVGDKPGWWRDYVTCMQSDDVLKNPNIYTTGGSDYKEGNTYVNVNGTQSNKSYASEVSSVMSKMINPSTTCPENCTTPHYTTPTGPNNICSNH